MKTNARARRGFALMLVILEMVLLVALWEVAHRQLAATLRFFQVQQERAQLAAAQGVEVHKPLARALGLLETGNPPDQGLGVYTCNLTMLTPSGPAYFLVTYQKQAPGAGPTSTDETWTVTSRQTSVSADELETWNGNLMPSTFE